MNFRFVVFTVGNFTFWRSWAVTVGDFRDFKSEADIPRANASNVTLITKGGCHLEMLDGSFSTNLMAGMTNQQCPDLKAGVVWRATALTADTEFFCIMHKDRKRFSATKFSATPQQEILVPTGTVVLVGEGQTNQGRGPFVIQASPSPFALTFDSTGFGVFLR